MRNTETVDAIISRRSVRSYTDRKPGREALEKLLECAMWAPSARNRQSCRVAVLTDTAALDMMDADFKNIVGKNTPAYTRWEQNPFYQGAPALFFIFSDEASYLDGGIMAENIVLAAESMGFGSCVIGCIRELLDSEKGREWKNLLGVPENSRFIVSVAVGEKAEKPEPKPRMPEKFFIVEKINR